MAMAGEEDGGGNKPPSKPKTLPELPELPIRRPRPGIGRPPGVPYTPPKPIKPPEPPAKSNRENSSGKSAKDALRSQPIGVLGLSKHANRILNRVGIDKVFKLTWYSEAELQHYFFRRDPTTVIEIRDAMKRKGLELGSAEAPENKFGLLYIGFLGLSSRTYSTLGGKLGIHLVKELTNYTAIDLRRTSNLPSRLILEIRESLRTMELALRGRGSPRHPFLITRNNQVPRTNGKNRI